MRVRTWRRSWVVAVLAAGLFAPLAGCTSVLKQVDVSMAAASFPGGAPTIEVDVVVVNDSELPEWKNLDVTDYFRPGTPANNWRQDARRRNEMVTVRFTAEESRPRQVDLAALSMTAAAKKPTHVVVIASLDPAQALSLRAIEPLVRADKPRATVLDVSVERSGLRTALRK